MAAFRFELAAKVHFLIFIRVGGSQGDVKSLSESPAEWLEAGIGGQRLCKNSQIIKLY